MRNPEADRREGEIVREVHKLLIELEELKYSSEKQVDDARARIMDLYIPRGLVNIHRLPKLGL